MIELTAAFTLAIFVVAVLIALGRHQQKAFDDRWPPISDDEFVAKCAPGTSLDTAVRVRRIIAEQLGVPYEQIHPEQEFVKDLYCD